MDGIVQIDDVIGLVTASTPKAAAFTFYHSVFWRTSMQINAHDKLNLWVTYKGWDQPNPNAGFGDLNVGAHVQF
jgi:hypothetical protein